jgi:glutamate synthase (NADPH/NADH) small chain
MQEPGEICGGAEGHMDACEQKQIRLHISEEIERVMEARGILREDIQQVIDHAETTGEKFINPSMDRSLAYLRPTRVTYWVEYSRVGDGFQIHSAYSHRMEMKRGEGYDGKFQIRR